MESAFDIQITYLSVTFTLILGNTQTVPKRLAAPYSINLSGEGAALTIASKYLK